MQWLRVRQAETNFALERTMIDTPSVIRQRLKREAERHGADLVRDRLVFMRRVDEWYTEFSLDINPPDTVVQTMVKRGWSVWV